MNQPHNDLELRNDLRKRIHLLLENVSFKCYCLQADCTSISEIVSVGKLILLCCWRSCIQICWCFNHHWLCLLRSSAAHINRSRTCCCGGRGTFEQRGFLLAVVTGKEVSGIITSYCDCTDPPQLLRCTGDD